MTESEQRGPIPPYVSFGTLLNQLERMTKEGVPGRVDSTFLVGMAGGTQNQFKHALRALGLIDDNDHPTDALRPLVNQPDDRPRLVGELLAERFPKLVELDQNATKGQLDEVLATYGLGTETRRKAASFYVAAATFAGIPLSPFLKPTRGPQVGGTPRRKSTARRKAKTDNGNGSGDALTNAHPATGHSQTVTLKSGGSVTLTYDVNMFEVSDDDEEFVLSLIKKLRKYSANAGIEGGDEGATS